MLIEATLCYLERDADVLLVRRGKKPGDRHAGKYNGLGGKLEPGESPLACARREIEEESGLRPQTFYFSGHIAFPEFDGVNDWSVFLFRAWNLAGTLRADGPEGALEWVPRDRVLALPLWEGDRHFLPWVFAGRRFLARFHYRGGRYVGHEVDFTDEVAPPPS